MTGQIAQSTLSVGIVTYNNASIIGGTLDSVLANLPAGISSQVLLIDNGSTDGTLDILVAAAARDHRVSVLENSQNIGFGAGHNRILRAVDSDYHIVCNPDVTVQARAVEDLLVFLNTNPDAGLVCPRVSFEDGRLQPLNKRLPTVFDLFLRRFLPSRWRRLFKRRMDRYEMLDVGYDNVCEVPVVSGAFFLARTALLKRVDGFDERFFLYFEDTDLSRRIAETGHRNLYCPHSTIVHAWRREAHRSLRGARLFAHSAAKYFGKWGWRLF